MSLSGSIFIKQGEPGANNFKYVEIRYREPTPAEGSVAHLQKVVGLTRKGKWTKGDNNVDHTSGNYNIGTGFGSVGKDHLFWEWSSILNQLTLFEIMEVSSYGKEKTPVAEIYDIKAAKSGSKFIPINSDVRPKVNIIHPGNNMTKGPAYWEDVL